MFAVTIFMLLVSGLSGASEAQIRIQPPSIRQAPSSTQPPISARIEIPPSIRGLTIDPTSLRTHVMRPQNLTGVSGDEGLDDPDANVAPVLSTSSLTPPSSSPRPGTNIRPRVGTVRPGITVRPQVGTVRPGITVRPQVGTIQPGTARPRPSPGTAPDLAAPELPHLDVNGFGEALHAALRNSVTGYFMRLQQSGSTIYTLQWNWSKTPPDGSQGWNPDRNMHIASVSKLMTAIAMTRLLNERNISFDAKIINFLPSYWQKGPNINQITFRHLLTHRSGFSTGGSSSDFQFMKARVAAGVIGAGTVVADNVIKIGKYDYENMNFGLCRILLAVINGNVQKNMTPLPLVADQIWDFATIQAYRQYSQARVFSPAGVGGASLDHPGPGALAYSIPNNNNGWNSGNLASMSGGAGWHMSPNEVLRVMSTFRRGGNIMPGGQAQSMLDNRFGIDRIIPSPAGNLYEKNGLWRDGNQRTEQNVAYFLPEGMELVVFANSPVGQNGASLRNLVRDTYLSNIVE